MSKYAEGTTVSLAQSRAEIERTLERYGASGFMYGQQGDMAMIAFAMKERHFRLTLKYPELAAYARTRTGVRRTPTQAKAAYDQEIKRLWRGLAMIIKAKLEAVDAGITTVEDEFMSATVLADNQTFGEWAHPQISQVYATGTMPPLLPGGNVRRLASPDYIEGEVMNGR